MAAPERTVADDYDSPWKEAIEHFFSDFMGFYFPEVHAQIDWAQPLVFLEQELRFRDDLMQLEEDMKMRYVNSVERLAREEGLAKGMQQGVQQGMQQGLQEGMEHGRRAGKALVIGWQLQVRFGELPDWVQTKLNAASETQLDAWTDQLLTAASIEAILGPAAH